MTPIPVPPLTSLSKANFWNDLTEKYPEEMKHFCIWIDEYKKRVDWNTLFNSNSNWQNCDGKNAPAPKYHDLPIAMQVGIIIQYFIETCDGFQLFFKQIPKNMHDFARIIVSFFEFKSVLKQQMEGRIERKPRTEP